MTVLKCIVVTFIITTTAASAPFFREDYVYHSDIQSFIKFHKVPSKFGMASRVCLNEGAQLMVAEGISESNIIQRFLAENETSYVGLHDIFTEGMFETLDQRPISEVYVKWAEGSPHLASYWMNCVVIDHNGLYSDTNCQTYTYFVCKKQLSSLTKNEACETYDIAYVFSEVTGDCYKLSERVANWREARRTCRAEGALLAMPGSQSTAEDLDVLLGLLRPLPLMTRTRYDDSYIHVGFHDLFLQGDFINADSGSPITLNLNWTSDYPYNSDSYRCGGLSREGTIQNTKCEIAARFICQKKLSTKSKPVAA